MRGWLIGALLFLTACNSTTRDAKSADLYLQLGITQLEKGLTQHALSSFLKAEQLDPESGGVHNQLGRTYFLLEKNKLALDHFEKAVKLEPSSSDARNNMARALIELGRTKEARKELNIVLSDLTYSNMSIALTHMGLLNFKEKRYSEAILNLQKAIRLNKSSCLTYTVYGRTMYESKNYKASLPAFEAALPLCKREQSDEAHYFAGLAYYKSGDKNRGIALMNETILLYPEGNYQSMAKSALEMMKFNRL